MSWPDTLPALSLFFLSLSHSLTLSPLSLSPLQRYVRHVGWDPDEIWGPAVGYTPDSNLVAGPRAAEEGVGASGVGAATSMAPVAIHDSLEAHPDDNADSAFTASHAVSAPARRVLAARPPLVHAHGNSTERNSAGGEGGETAAAFNPAVLESEAEEQEWIRQGAPRWLIRELEGDSSGAKEGCAGGLVGGRRGGAVGGGLLSDCCVKIVF